MKNNGKYFKVLLTTGTNTVSYNRTMNLNEHYDKHNDEAQGARPDYCRSIAQVNSHHDQINQSDQQTNLQADSLNKIKRTCPAQ